MTSFCHTRAGVCVGRPGGCCCERASTYSPIRLEGDKAGDYGEEMKPPANLGSLPVRLRNEAEKDFARDDNTYINQRFVRDLALHSESGYTLRVVRGLLGGDHCLAKLVDGGDVVGAKGIVGGVSPCRGCVERPGDGAVIDREGVVLAANLGLGAGGPEDPGGVP
jgi:hypothetical protein